MIILKPWLYSKINIIIILIIFLKKNKMKNKIIYISLKSKKIFFYEYFVIIEKIKNLIIKNFLKFKKKYKKNINKLKIIKIIILNNIIKYKLINIKIIKKSKENYYILENKFFWKKSIIPIILLIIINISISKILINKNKKINILYKICGKLNKINNEYLQIIEGLIKLIINNILYIINLIILNKIKR